MQKLLYLTLAFLTLVADQLSKWWAMETMIRPLLNDAQTSRGFLEWLTSPGDRLAFVEIEVLPFFNIVMVWNNGISFGIFNQETDYGPLILIILAAVIIIWFLIWLFRTSSKAQQFAIALVIGGAIGNVLDRLRYDAVIDFLDFHAYGYHWPAFNIGDSCIVIGVLLLIMHSFFFDRRGGHDA